MRVSREPEELRLVSGVFKITITAMKTPGRQSRKISDAKHVFILLAYKRGVNTAQGVCNTVSLSGRMLYHAAIKVEGLLLYDKKFKRKMQRAGISGNIFEAIERVKKNKK